MFLSLPAVIAVSLSLSAGQEAGFPGDHGVEAGLAVHVGTTDGRVESDLAAGGRRLVHGLALGAAEVARAREVLRAGGTYGVASVEEWMGPRLPYADDLVNLLVADLDRLGDRAPARQEIDRVLAPRGVAVLRTNGKWTRRKKAVPSDTDEWTHYDHGADGNPVSGDARVAPSTALRWYAAPTVSRAGSQREAGLRLSGGRIVYALKDYGVQGRLPRNAKHHLVCRDAHNGILLWKIPVAGEEHTPYRHELVADASRVYTTVEAIGPMVALDAETGEKRVTYDEGVQVEKMGRSRINRPDRGGRHLVARLFRNRLIQAYRSRLVVLDAATGKKQWDYDAGEGRAVGLVVAAEGKVFAAVGREKIQEMRGTVATRLGDMVAFDLESGRELWRNRDLDGSYLVRLVYQDGLLPVACFSGKDRKGRDGSPMSGFGHLFRLVALSAADGKVVWTQKQEKSAGGHYAITFVRDGKAYVSCERYFGFDLSSGEPAGGFHQRTFVNSCAETRATPNWILYGMSFGDAEGRLSPRAIVRSTCDTGVFPANGLIYCSPPLCMCLDVVAGYTALASEPPAVKIRESERTFGEAVKGTRPGVWPASADWPMFLGGPKRGSITAGKVGADLSVAWTSAAPPAPRSPLAAEQREAEIAGNPVTAPTAAGGRIFVAYPHEHRIAALDGATGREVWSFTTGGRIDSPPTIYAGACFVGSRDGWVYALRAEDGRVAWKYLAAPTRKRIVSDGHLESPWPVLGSIMVHQGMLYGVAGRHSAVDGGIRLVKLDPFSGKAAWRARIFSGVVEKETAKNIPTYPHHGEEGRYYPRKAHLLVSDGKRLHHFIETLEDDYPEGGLVSIHPTNGRWNKRVKVDGMNWLRSNLPGFVSRRTESIGRFDHAGVRYGPLQASAVAFSGDTLYCADGRENRAPKGKYGALTRLPLKPDGSLGDRSVWTARLRHADGTRESGNIVTASLVATADAVFLAGHLRDKETSFVHAYAASDGAKLGQWALPARPVRHGMIAAGGRLIVSLESGAVVALGR